MHAYRPLAAIFLSVLMSGFAPGARAQAPADVFDAHWSNAFSLPAVDGHIDAVVQLPGALTPLEKFVKNGATIPICRGA
jgi:hypothetical protein